ncbi:autophagy-related protein 12 [Aspergillus nomiae NRRL 13137]|uniref:Ubiquitin-like protein ATG12 n=1 Tax=Aspergillus nomiae NRRL (strain ATCC 15546 / NRRL 13137 / CBS 260.88 / M93) TaxID=1509407 RepID=A0A0L1J245_ASPN3|nr:autophagy-related protein 12 [Aspergillus nomiae NRRL 13137]KNG85463.1 autophagy-related protein 12 [Aspergillus nomiae NRRL 13137]
MDPSSSQNPSQDSPRPSQNLSAGSRASLSHRPASRKQSSDSTSNNRNAPIPDDEHGADMPLTMSASVVLTSLPRDAHQALADAEAVDKGKVTVRFQPLASAPILKNKVFKISASQKFETVVKFLRKKLDCKETDSVFCYVNSVFAPGLDEGVGGLWRCFKVDDQLIVSYSMTPAFG